MRQYVGNGRRAGLCEESGSETKRSVPGMHGKLANCYSPAQSSRDTGTEAKVDGHTCIDCVILDSVMFGETESSGRMVVNSATEKLPVTAAVDGKYVPVFWAFSTKRASRRMMIQSPDSYSGMKLEPLALLTAVVVALAGTAGAAVASGPLGFEILGIV